MEEGGQPADSSKNNRVRLAIASVAALVGVGVLYWGYESRIPSVQARAPKQAWYYELSTKKLFTATAGVLPLGTSRDGTTGVLAHVFSCGECDSSRPDKQWAGYLERIPDELVEKWRRLQPVAGAPTPDPASAMQTAKEQFDVMQAAEIASVDNLEEWVNYMGDDAHAIRAAMVEKCPEGTLQECFPNAR